MTPDTVHLSLRLTPEIHARLKALADRERRSMHAQVVWMLERALPVTRMKIEIVEADGWQAGMLVPDDEPPSARQA